jgi:hypothetical protein
MRELWPMAGVFVILVALFMFVFLVAREPGPSDAPPAHGDAALDGGDEAPDPAEVLKRFLEVIEKRQPKYDYVELECPACGEQLAVPEQASQESNNRFGGVATDIMSIALSPPPADGGRPGLESQDWEMLLATCAGCGASFHYLDVYHIRGGRYAISGWDLGELAPSLAQRDPMDWTVEERIYTRVLSLRAAGVEDVEQGFAALQGAYAANFGTWYGNTVHVPSPAFYALAAASFAVALETDTEMNTEARAVTAMTMGECLRLLGRDDDAKAAFELVHELADEAFDPERIQHKAALDALSQLEGLLAAGDHSLQRAQVAAAGEPPVGWYIDEMLPAINGHLDQHRSDWSELVDLSEIHVRINALMP